LEEGERAGGGDPHRHRQSGRPLPGARGGLGPRGRSIARSGALFAIASGHAFGERMPVMIDAPFIDAQFESLPYRPCEIVHRYGERVHILSDPLALTMLGRLCAKGTVQPEVNRLVGELYRML